MINLSETLPRVPGMFAAESRRTTRRTCRSARADSRARAAFGVRGVRLYQDEHSGDDARRAGQTGSFSLLFGAADRSAARAVLDAVRQCVGRRHLGVHRGRTAPVPIAAFNAGGGSYGTWTASA